MRFFCICATVCFLCVASLCPQSGNSFARRPLVVFVCEHGSAKSIIAASEFKSLAKEKGLDVEVLARGTNPDSEIPSVVRDGLKADGHDIGPTRPTKDSENDLKNATKIVSFGPDVSPWLAEGTTVADWSATPSVNKDYRAARDYIRKQIEIVLREFK